VFEPKPTAFDLRFRLFCTPVRVHPGFWLMTLLLGFQNFADGVGFFVLWVGCVFFSILAHEFGHITMGRFCGRGGNIILYSFGGLAIGDYQVPHRWQRMAISLAGPAAGFLFYGIVLLVKDHLLSQIPLQFLIQNPGLVQVIDKGTAMLLGINLIWSLLNLVPIMPLDGGNFSQELFSAVNPRNGLRLSLTLSIFLALLAAGYCMFAWSSKVQLPYGLHGGLTALLLGLMAFDCFLMLRAENQRIREEDSWIRENEGRL
jgi:stage IV sporulation protein FB